MLPEGTQFAPVATSARYRGTGARRRCSSVRLSNHPGLISLVAYAGCPVARECLVVQVEFHSVSGVSTRGPLDHNISPQTTCVFVRALCYARTPRKTNSIVFMYKNKLTSNTRFRFSPAKDSWAHGARGLNPGAISSLPVFFEPGLARAGLVEPKFSRQIVTTAFADLPLGI